MLQWLIIGGGIQGLTISRVISKIVGADSVRIVDPHQPLAVWKRRCHNCGMQYLRSPGGHNVEDDIQALFRFGRTHQMHEYRPRYQRPSYRLFNAHTQSIIAAEGLDSLYMRAHATSITIQDHQVKVETTRGHLQARNILLALGNRYLHIPQIFRDAMNEALPIYHLYAQNFQPSHITRATRLLIIGGGISAIQFALYCSARPSCPPPTVITRGPVRTAHFDSDPCYLGPKCLKPLLAISDYQERLARIHHSRNPGTVPPDLAHRWQQAVASHRIQHLVGTPASLSYSRTRTNTPLTNDIIVQLHNGTATTSDCVVLATGFDAMVAKEPLLKETALHHNLPQHNHTPIIDKALRWHPRMVLTGAPAVLELGPAAGNIIGARLALRRIVPRLLEA